MRNRGERFLAIQRGKQLGVKVAVSTPCITYSNSYLSKQSGLELEVDSIRSVAEICQIPTVRGCNFGSALLE